MNVPAGLIRSWSQQLGMTGVPIQFSKSQQPAVDRPRALPRAVYG